MIFLFNFEITRYRRTGYNLNLIRQSACLVFNPIMVDNYAALFSIVGQLTQFVSPSFLIHHGVCHDLFVCP